MQIRAGQHNEAILVKRAIDSYHQSCASTIGAGRYVPEDYSFRSFEKFLYLSLRKLQRNGADHLKGLPETAANPLLCTQSTHRCMHATHAYTGIPCAAYRKLTRHLHQNRYFIFYFIWHWKLLLFLCFFLCAKCIYNHGTRILVQYVTIVTFKTLSKFEFWKYFKWLLKQLLHINMYKSIVHY
jgi:hypothetical protein